MTETSFPTVFKPISGNQIRKRIGKPCWFKRITRTASAKIAMPELLMPGRKSREWAGKK